MECNNVTVSVALQNLPELCVPNHIRYYGVLVKYFITGEPNNKHLRNNTAELVFKFNKTAKFVWQYFCSR